MKLEARVTDPTRQRSACLVVGVFEKRRLSAAAAALDQAMGGRLTRLLKRGDLEGKPGQTLLLPEADGTGAERILLVGCGRERDFNARRFRQALEAAVRTLDASGARDAVIYLTDLEVEDRDIAWRMRQAARHARAAVYRFTAMKSDTDEPARPLKKLTFNVPSPRDLKRAAAGLAEGTAVADGMDLARDLGNLPGNVCTPSYLAARARKLAAADSRLRCTVLGRKEMEKLGMGALLAVAKGSRQPPKFIVLEYRGLPRGTQGARAKPLVLVGKGITFDSGGISIKPAQAMDEMKFDMCGAASVLGTFLAVSRLKPAVNLVGLIPTCENLPDGAANKPGDIITSMAGKTIEVLNTDAEGRLILCDALAYAERYQPRAIVDIATLTGACVIALGKHASGLLGNDQALVDQILAAGEAADDRAWQLPLWEEYQEQLKSNFADMANIGGREAGTITAACFLARFVEKQKWAHLDIAGTAWESGNSKGATGRPVPLLTRFVLERAGHK